MVTAAGVVGPEGIVAVLEDDDPPCVATMAPTAAPAAMTTIRAMTLPEIAAPPAAAAPAALVWVITASAFKFPESGGNANLHLPRHLIRHHAAHRGLAIGVGEYRHALAAVGENAAGAVVGKEERDRDARYRLMIFVLHLHDGFSGRALADIVDGAFALENRDGELLGLGRLRACRRCGVCDGDNLREHRA